MTENTYWNSKGRFQDKITALQALIPDTGVVKSPYKNKALERFRKASNAYYRLYNDGDFGVGPAKMFRVEYPSQYKEYYFYSDYRGKLVRSSRWSQKLYDAIEPVMDEIIYMALVEQNLI